MNLYGCLQVCLDRLICDVFAQFEILGETIKKTGGTEKSY